MMFDACGTWRPESDDLIFTTNPAKALGLIQVLNVCCAVISFEIEQIKLQDYMMDAKPKDGGGRK